MIIYQYTAFRHWFAQVARTQNVSLTYDNASSPNTISRLTGSFVTDGHQVGMRMQVLGTPDNDSGWYEIGAVSALSMSLIAGQNFTSSYTDTSSLVSSFYELDGMEKWPQDLVRANGFDDGFGPSATPFLQFPITLSVNGGVTDATAGTSYTWYLSQRTPIAANQHFTMDHADATKTGTVTLALTATAVSDAQLASATANVNVGQRITLLNNVYIYCQRQSDKAIQRAHLLTLSDAQPV